MKQQQQQRRNQQRTDKKKRKRAHDNDGKTSNNNQQDEELVEEEVSSSSSLWKKVDVSLPEAVLPGNHYDDDDNNNEDEEDNDNRNNKRSSKKPNKSKLAAERDLEASGGEEMGIFLGLEVLAPEHYRVEEDPTTGVKRFQLLSNNNKSNSNKSSRNNDDTSASKKIKTKKPPSQLPPSNQKQEAVPIMTTTTTTAKAPSEGSNKKETKKKDEKESNIRGTTTVTDDIDHEDDKEEVVEVDDDEELVQKMQLSWMAATGGVPLHAHLSRALIRLNFWTPTPIQAAALPASIVFSSQNNCNIVGAAPTGSGKTLAFLLPIGQDLLQLRHGDDDDDDDDDIAVINNNKNPLLALILTPTRELALQIQHACDSLFSLSSSSNSNKQQKQQHQQKQPQKHVILQSVAVVGGLAVPKQMRLLHKQPPIVVATPGRLWDLISKQSHPHLRDLSRIRHLVVDEADRMIRQGSFPELTRILDAVHVANSTPMNTSMTKMTTRDKKDKDKNREDNDNVDDDDEEEDGRLLGLPGIAGEAKVEMLTDDILQQMMEQQQATVHDDPPPQSDDDEHDDDDHDDSDEEEVEEEEDEREVEVDDIEETSSSSSSSLVEEEEEKKQSSSSPPPIPRRTYVFSATLTLPASSSSFKKRNRNVNVDGAIAEILEKARAKGRTKIVDLTNGSSSSSKNMESNVAARLSGKVSDTTKSKKSSSESKKRGDSGDDGGGGAFRLPPGLTLRQIKCTQKHKDSHLYGYLMTTKQGSSGPCLVFCNSIVAVRRVGATLQALGLDVRILHAQMQQRARLKAVESLQKSCRSVVVATDVAARGLDIPSVASVVHYDVPRTVDMFIHRSGRTARGVGEGATGSSLSLIAPGDDKNYAQIARTLKLQFQPFPLDGRLLRAAQERVNLACKVVSAEDGERRSKRDSKWFHDQAAEAGLEVDEALIEDDVDKNQSSRREALRAKAQLSKLLAEPMQTQRYGKFLSTNTALSQIRTVAPTTVKQQQRKRRKRS